MYHEYAYGAGRPTFADLPSAPTAAAAIDRLTDGHRLLDDDLDALAALDDPAADDALDAPVLTNWGEHWPAWRIFTTMTDHDAHHGGEIGCLRDLYRAWAG
jgi:hypothetical protein